MDKHKQLQENLVAYLVDELSQAERAELDEHLRTCESCRESLARYRAVMQAAEAVPDVEPSAGFTERVLGAAHAAEEMERKQQERLAQHPAPEKLTPAFSFRRFTLGLARVVVYASVVVIALIIAIHGIPPLVQEPPAGTQAGRPEAAPNVPEPPPEEIAAADRPAPPFIKSKDDLPETNFEFDVPPLDMVEELPPSPVADPQDPMYGALQVLKTEVHNPAYAARLDWRERKEAMRATAAGSSSAHAVRRGIWWLVRHQDPDGKWDAVKFASHCRDRNCRDTSPAVLPNEAVTAAALLAMLGDGNVPGNWNEFQVRVARGIQWLQSRQQANGAIGEERPNDPNFILTHSLATAALAEAYGMTGDKRCELAARKAAEYLIAHEPKLIDAKKNLITEAMPAAAVRLAALGTVEISRLDLPRGIATRGAAVFAEIGSRPSTAFTYPYPGPTTSSRITPAMIAIAAPGVETEKDLILGEVGRLRGDLPDWKTNGPAYWLAGSAVMKKAGGAVWRTWSQTLQNVLIEHQQQSGHAIGSWAPNDTASRLGGRVFSTALAILALETPYR